MEDKEMRTRAVDRALDILECFNDGGDYALIDIAHKTGLSSATALRLLGTLMERGFISRDPETKKYALGSAITRLGSCADRTNEAVKDAASSAMDELYKKYNENVRLFVLEGDYRVCLDQRESTQDIRQIIRVGDRKHIDTGASGLLFLAYMNPKKRAQLVTNLVIDDNNFDDIYVDGYALSNDNDDSGIIAISAPIFDKDGKMIAALSLSGPSYRFINKEMTDKIQDTVYFSKIITERLKRSNVRGCNR